MNNLVTVSKYTFLELIKSKILIFSVFLGFAIVISSYVLSEFTYGAQFKVGLDFGLGILSLSSNGIAIFLGVSLVAKEIENRTIFPILTRPVSRTSFLLGKFLGLEIILFLNCIILSGMSLIIFKVLGGEPSSLVGWSILFSFLEASIILCVVIFFSLITNPTMSVIYTIMILILGHALTSALTISFVSNRGALSALISSYSVIFPNFSRLNIKEFVLYNKSLPLDFLFSNMFYATFYIMVILIASCLVFNKRNLD